MIVGIGKGEGRETLLVVLCCVRIEIILSAAPAVYSTQDEITYVGR